MYYHVKLTEKQMRVIQLALEEYFRLRLGQAEDFCNDMAMIDREFPKDKNEHDRVFNAYINRRDHLKYLMDAFYNTAFEPDRYLNEKTDDMMIAECIWDAMRFARGIGRYGDVLPIGSEPVPEIQKVEE